MFKKTRVRFIIIAVVVILAGYSLYWSIAYSTMSEAEKENLKEKGELEKYHDRILHLGLDLQGGIHLVLQMDIPKLVQNLASNKDDKFYDLVEQTQNISREKDTDFLQEFKNQVREKNIKLARYMSDLGYKNENILNQLDQEAKDARSRALAVIRNRVNQFGVSEPIIQKQGEDRIIVQLAGIEDPQRARTLLQRTANLEFKLMKDPRVTQSLIESIDEYYKSGEGTKVDTAIAEGDTSEADSTVEVKEAQDTTVSVEDILGPQTDQDTAGADSTVVVDKELMKEKPFSSLLRSGREGIILVKKENKYLVDKMLNEEDVQDLFPYNSDFYWSPEPEPITLRSGTTEEFYKLYHLNKEADLKGTYITDAEASIGGGGTAAGQNIVNITLNNRGARELARLTGANVGERLAIVLDNSVYMAPSIRQKITGGRPYIEGFDNMEQAKDIAIVLRAGALPAPVDIINERTVGPTLGQASVDIGVKLMLISFVIVIVFMVIYYKKSGLIADLALILNLIIVMAVLAYFNATLTLPGVAGLILTVGIAVDNNVLIFERIREELEKGKTVKSAIDSGYKSAFTAIWDANFTTIITSFILMQFGTGPVKGFAVTLLTGVIASFFTAIFVTRTIYNYMTEKKVKQTLSI
jgi:preprotein translocase subunit SecD